MKIGFFGGCFNPPTNAHIGLAKEALIACKLDKVIFVPMGDFYPKKALAKAKDRYKMLQIACENNENVPLEVSDLELNVKQKLHTIDAFRLIQKNYPHDELYFIMGADNFVQIENWKESEKLKEYQYIVFEREGIDLKNTIEKSKTLKQYQGNIQMIQNERYQKYSATKFRSLFHTGTTKEQDMIPSKVLEFIIKNQIYEKRM